MSGFKYLIFPFLLGFLFFFLLRLRSTKGKVFFGDELLRAVFGSFLLGFLILPFFFGSLGSLLENLGVCASESVTGLGTYTSSCNIPGLTFLINIFAVVVLLYFFGGVFLFLPIMAVCLIFGIRMEFLAYRNRSGVSWVSVALYVVTIGLILYVLSGVLLAAFVL